MGGHANARVRGFLHSTTRYMYLEHGCTRFCAGGGRWPGRRNEKGPKYVPNKETRYKMRAHAQRWYRTVVPAAPGRAWGTTWPGPTDTNPPGTIWGRPGAVTGDDNNASLGGIIHELDLFYQRTQHFMPLIEHNTC